MGIPQTAVALTSGQSVSIPVSNPNRVSCIELYNGTPYDLTVSGYGVQGGGTIISAGLGHRLFGEIHNSGYLNMTAVNNTGATATGVVNLIFYEANEKLPPGQFPVTIPSQIVSAKVSGVQTLTNETSTDGAEIIDIGTVSINKLIDIFNNHFKLSVEIAGVEHTVLQGSLTGNPTQIGKAGDTAEVLGNLAVDSQAGIGTLPLASIQEAILAAADTFKALVLQWHSATQSADMLEVQDNLNNVKFSVSPAGNVTASGILTVTGKATFNGASPSVTVANDIEIGIAGNVKSNTITIVGTDGANKVLFLNAPNVGNGGVIELEVGGTAQASVDVAGIHAASGNAIFFSQGSFLNISPFTGTGSGTFATGIASGTSFQILTDACTLSGSSQTMGATKGGTNSVVTTGAGLAWSATAYN